MAENFLIIGLGNPGREYRETRHNVGFMLLDRLAVKLNARFTRLQSRALVASATYSERKIILAKPQTFMNLSGQSVPRPAAWYHSNPSGWWLGWAEGHELGPGTTRYG